MDLDFLKNRRGQISIEFILIVLIIIIYIHSVVQPTLMIATESAQDTTRISNVKLAAEKLAGTINQLEASQGNGRKTIDLFVPEKSYVECTPTSIDFGATLSDRLGTPAGCSNGMCSSSIQTLATNLSCNFGETPAEKIDATESSVLMKVSVTKSGSSISVVNVS